MGSSGLPRNSLHWPILVGFLSFSIISCFLALQSDVLICIVSSLVLVPLLFPLSGIVESYLFTDSVSTPLLSLTGLVVLFSLLVSKSGSVNKVVIVLSIPLVTLFFLAKNLIVMYVMFELSLVPIFVLVISFGSQPERLIASNYMAVYTFVASAPLLAGVIWLGGWGGGWTDLLSHSQFLGNESLGAIDSVSVCFVLAFLVKAPIYLLHSWLPRAHVEAPLEGSILLAGVILKVGVYGLIRFIEIYPRGVWENIWNWVFSVALVGSVYSIIIAISVDDVNICVAYSSISHMNLCVASVSCMSIVSCVGCVLTIVCHGLTSSVLFINVTVAYSITNSRSVLVNKGLLGKVPFLKVFSLLMWASNISIPPFLSFVGELELLTGVVIPLYCNVVLSWVYSFLFITISSVFSILGYSVIHHGGAKIFVKFFPPLIPFMIISLCSGGVQVCLFFATTSGWSFSISDYYT